MNMIYIFRNNTKGNFMEKKKKETEKEKNKQHRVGGSSKEKDRGKKT